MPDYRHAATQIARKHGIPPALLKSLISHESGWNPNARSPVGAIGLAQFMPATAKGLGVNPRDPMSSLDGAARYLAKAKRSFGRWDLALAAYNAGFGAVSKYKGIPPYAETQRYVKNIMASASLAAGSPSPLRSPGAPIGGGKRNQRLAAALGPTPGLQEILGRSVGEDIAGLLGPIQLPSSQSPRGGALPTASVQAGLTGNWKKWVSLAPGADRQGAHTAPAVEAFVGSIGKAAGRRLTIGTGTNHSRMTVNGNESQHWTGHAADIPASGAGLRKLGYLALIRAGMPRAQAAKARKTGGLFNVGRYQIIFATDEGGNHYNHLHVGVH